VSRSRPVRAGVAAALSLQCERRRQLKHNIPQDTLFSGQTCRNPVTSMYHLVSPNRRAGEVPRPPAVVQLAYRRPAPPAGKPPCTCVLLHVAATGLTPKLRSLLQSAKPLKVTTDRDDTYDAQACDL
jgi:hypothetical protein